METRPDITPDLTVGDLLRYYPDLEGTLIAMSPEFRRLKNPILRRTIAKIATLRQVAKVGGVSLGDLVNRLRGAAGAEPASAVVAEEGLEARPDWWKEPAASYDAREDIEAGGHPLERVMKDLQALPPGAVLELVTPFVPAPLLDVARRKGFRTWTAPPDRPGEVRSYFTRASEPGRPDRS